MFLSPGLSGTGRATEKKPPRKGVAVIVEKRTKLLRTALNSFTVVGFLLVGAMMFYGWQMGIFNSPENLQTFLTGFGLAAPFLFLLIQAVQVIVPILPGSMGCVVGVLAFGPWMGFFYNYIGICAGSFAAFWLARHYGRAFVKAVTKKKQYEKYVGWLDKGDKFDLFFAVAIFLPVAPDDLLCYLAGLTKMKLKRFIWIILLGKPLALWLYSMGVTSILTWILGGS